MKISIITATWNSGATLRDTIESVLAQSYVDFEHIIVDGGSTDSTLDIIREYEPKYEGRLRWISEPDHGIYDAMNKGIRMAKGDIVGILNSDDFYSSNHSLKHIADAAKDVQAVYGDLVFVDPVETSKIVRTWKGSQHVPGGFMKGWHPAHPTFYAQKDLFDRFGGFNIDLGVSADFELMLRFLEKGKCTSKYVSEVLVKMRMGGESTGSLRKIIEGNKNVLRAFELNGFKKPPFYILRRIAPKVLNVIKSKLK